MSAIKKLLYPVLLISIFFTNASDRLYAQKTLTKEINQEVTVPKGSLVRIISSSRKLNIKTWDQAKVKVTVQLNYDSSVSSRTDESWFEDLGISIKPFSNRVDILSRANTIQRKILGNKFSQEEKRVPTQLNEEELALTGIVKTAPKIITADGFSAPRKMVPGEPALRIMTVMVPTSSRLDVESKYGDVVIAMNLDVAKLEVSNGTLDAQDIKDLTLISDYCNVNLGNVEKGDVEFYNGTFRAQNIKDLDMDSRSSTVEYEKGDYLYLRSQTDEIGIQEINKVDGRKVYGSIKIDQLNGSFDLEGTNADIKFRNISPEVSLIKINNKYGDVRLPVKNLKNYHVDFTGYYSTVFAPFQKQVVREDDLQVEDNQEKEKIAFLKATQNNKPGTQVGELAPRRFTSTIGDNKGKHTRIELICNSCTVDFK